MLKTIIMVGMGSCLGGIVRYLASRFIQEHVMCSFPLGSYSKLVVICFNFH